MRTSRLQSMKAKWIPTSQSRRLHRQIEHQLRYAVRCQYLHFLDERTFVWIFIINERLCAEKKGKKSSRLREVWASSRIIIEKRDNAATRRECGRGVGESKKFIRPIGYLFARSPVFFLPPSPSSIETKRNSQRTWNSLAGTVNLIRRLLKSPRSTRSYRARWEKFLC